MKKVLILEDIEANQQAMTRACLEVSPDASIQIATTYEEACNIAFLQHIDLFVLDIVLSTKIPGDISGIKFAENIRKHEDYMFTPIIFITGLADPQMYAFHKLHCFGYLEKPFRMEEAKALIAQAMRYRPQETREQDIFLKKNGVLLAIQVQDVIYATAGSHIMNIHLVNDQIEIPYITIKQFLAECKSGRFMQCSRSAVVNKSHIRNIDLGNRFLEMSDGSTVDIGGTYVSKIRREIYQE